MSEDKPKEPMIGSQNRPSPIDFDAPVAQLKLRDLVTAVQGQLIEKEQFKEYSKPEKENIKGDQYKEHFKEHFKEQWKELTKPEKELLKPEQFKPELFKPELSKPELSKPDPFDDATIERIADRVAAVLKQRG